MYQKPGSAPRGIFTADRPAAWTDVGPQIYRPTWLLSRESVA
jgi:hypothetical protein